MRGDVTRRNVPRNVGEPRHAANDGTGDTNSDGVDAADRTDRAVKYVENLGEAGVGVRQVAGGGDKTRPRCRTLEDAEQRFCSTNITADNHRWIILVSSW